MKRGQVSMEILSAIGIILLIFVMVFSISITKRNEVSDTELHIKERSDCLKLSNLIIAVFINGPGTSVNTTIDYDAVLEPNNQVLYVKNKYEVYCSLPLNAYADQEVSEGKINIKNQNNTIIIENV